jgi:hypothetical protein
MRTEQMRMAQRSFRVASPPADADARAREVAVKWLRRESKAVGEPLKVVDEVLTRADLPKLPRIAGAAETRKAAGR